ncbi:siderophore-interacting protein [Kribbella italica]|uniref:NADPH-dependent ferric siderophore reductase n=1 Tax=Kribbella italica TaxID=1540520 RepID=A0A7W9J8P7_9ACTN|nr:siderophore-interacting protein [Kribbella italica]MBB5837192.1 NADPH-dependent ferric siderophore reductase [Kribbella italica]
MPRRARPTVVQTIALRELEVTRVVDVTPGLRRVTLTGDQLGSFTASDGTTFPAFASEGFDDSVRLIFPYPGESEPVVPVYKDGKFRWPADPPALWRVYTVRRYDAQARELDIDFVKHGVGVATTWAYRANPGDRLHVGGPSVSERRPEDYDWHLVVGDDTAVPAIDRLLGELPADAQAEVYLEVAEESHRIELPAHPGVEVTWVVRNGQAAAAQPLLLEAVRAAGRREGAMFAWLAGEQSVVRDLRRYLIEERGVDKADIDFTGYWRRAEVVASDEDPALPDLERNDEAFEKFHELSELLPPLAIRAAANLGIADCISRGVRTVPALAQHTGANERSLAKFLRYLQAIELLEQEGDDYTLSETGEFLTDESVLDHLVSNGVESRMSQGFYGLEEAVRHDRPVQDWEALRGDATFEHKYLENKSRFVHTLAEPLAKAPALQGAGTVVVHAAGAAVHADHLTAGHPEARVTIVALPTAAEWFRKDIPTSIADTARRDRVRIVEQSVFEKTDPADAVLIIETLGQHRDAEARLILQQAAASLHPGGRILLSEATFDPAELDEHDAELDLLRLTLHGSGYRTEEELEAVIASAGLKVIETSLVGWGNTLRVLTP